MTDIIDCIEGSALHQNRMRDDLEKREAMAMQNIEE